MIRLSMTAATLGLALMANGASAAPAPDLFADLAAPAPQAAAPAAQPLPQTYAEALAKRVVGAQPDMLNILFHVTPPGQTQNKVVATYLPTSLNEVSGADDLGVMQGAPPLVEVQKDGTRIGVVVQLKDRAGQPIGALGLMYRYVAGENQAAFLHRSETIRDRLAQAIPSQAALFRPA